MIKDLKLLYSCHNKLIMVLLLLLIKKLKFCNFISYLFFSEFSVNYLQL